MKRIPFLLVLCSAIAASDWPGMGGPRGTYSVQDDALPAQWSPDAMKVAWRAKLTGVDSPGQLAVADGLVHLVDQSADSMQAILRVFDLTDGRERWTTSWATPTAPTTQTKRPWSMPMIGPQHIFISGPEASSLRAIDRRTHQPVWVADISKLGVEMVPQASPHLTGNLLLCSVKIKGTDLLLALDAATGAERWRREAPFITGFNASLQNAPQVATIAEVRQAVFHHTSGVCGVGLDGTLLWNWTDYRRGTLTATPTVTPGGFIYVSSGHEGSCALFQVTRNGSEWQCRTVFCDGEKGKNEVTVNGVTAHLIYGNWNVTSAAWWEGSFYATGQKGLHCLREDGTIAWTSDTGEANNPSTIVVNGRVFTLTQPKRGGCELLVAAADRTVYRRIAQIPIHSKVPKTALVYADGHVLSHGPNDQEIVCVTLQPPKENQ